MELICHVCGTVTVVLCVLFSCASLYCIVLLCFDLLCCAAIWQHSTINNKYNNYRPIITVVNHYAGQHCVCMVFQALLANISAMYAVYHGPDGLRETGCKVHNTARLLALGNVIFPTFIALSNA